MYNESDAVIDEYGKSTRTKGEEVSLNILLTKMGDLLFYGEQGRFVEHGIVFQISEQELDDNSFTITSGKTFLEFGGDTYRILSVVDYTQVYHTQLMQCKAVKVIDAD